jgi:multiple sugar transport system ATP-binding protein
MKDGLIQQVRAPKRALRPARQPVRGRLHRLPPMNFFNGRLEQKGGALWFNEGKFSVRVDDAHAAKLHNKVGQEIVFGIRPEDVADTIFVSNPNPEHTIKARVEVVEPMGAETYLYLNTGLHAFIARVNARGNVDVNQELSVVFTQKKAHYFDKASGLTLA